MPRDAPAFLDSPRGRIFRALRSPAFRRLYSATVLSQLGFWVAGMTHLEVARSLSDGSPRALGLLVMFQHLPQLALAPLTGVAADRFSRRRIIMLGYGTTTALIGLLGILQASGLLTLPLLYAIGLCLGAANAWVGPANMAAVADAVPARDLPSAVSLGSVGMNFTRVVGPLVAALVLVRFGPAPAYLGFAVILSVVLGLFSRIELRRIERDPGAESILGRLRTGLAHARERHPAFPVLITVGVLSVFGVSHSTLHAVFAQHVLGRPELFPVLGAGTGIGAILGALATGLRSKPLSLRRAGRHALGFGLALVAFSQMRSPWTAIGAQVAVGYFYFSSLTMLQTLVQQSIDDAKRGRVMSLFSVGWGGLMTLGGPLMGYVAEYWLSTSSTILAGGAVCALFGLYRGLGGGDRPRHRRYTPSPS